jgi:hypothetical protein
MVKTHHVTIKLHSIPIGNTPIIMGLPCLRKDDPDIHWKERHMTFKSTSCTKVCLTALPDTTTVSEPKVIGDYYRDTPLVMASQDTVCSNCMVVALTFQEELEDGIEGTPRLKEIDKILDVWEVYQVDMKMTRL